MVMLAAHRGARLETGNRAACALRDKYSRPRGQCVAGRGGVWSSGGCPFSRGSGSLPTAERRTPPPCCGSREQAVQQRDHVKGEDGREGQPQTIAVATGPHTAICHRGRWPARTGRRLWSASDQDQDHSATRGVDGHAAPSCRRPGADCPPRSARSRRSAIPARATTPRWAVQAQRWIARGRP